MEEPSRRASRSSIAGVVLGATVVGAGGFVLGRTAGEPTPPPSPAAASAPSPNPPRAPVLPKVQPRLGRAELIAAASSAADALASGRPLPETVTGLPGRDFELRLPFGCPGGQQSAAPGLSVEYDAAAEALRVRAEPFRWAPGEWLPKPRNIAEAAPSAEGLEGFWISRPWVSSEDCPPTTPLPTSAETPSKGPEQTLGIAQFFTPNDSRVGRRNGRAFEAVESVAPGALDMSLGLQLRLRGKLARAPGAGPVLCRVESGMRPVCILSASFDEVAIENPATGGTLATWDVSSQTREPAVR